MLEHLGQAVIRRERHVSPWTNVYGVGRSVLAIATAATLLCNRPSTLFRPGTGVPTAPICDGVGRIGLFCLASSQHLSIARWVAIVVLLIAASGYRPRFTGVAHW